MCKYVYLDERDTSATTNKVCQEVCECVCVCVCVCVLKHLFFLNKQTVQEVPLCLYVIYWEPEVLVPLDHDWKRLHGLILYMCVCVCVCVWLRVRFRSMSTHRPVSQQLS